MGVMAVQGFIRVEGRKGGAQPDMGMHNSLHVFVCVGGGGARGSLT